MKSPLMRTPPSGMANAGVGAGGADEARMPALPQMIPATSSYGFGNPAANDPARRSPASKVPPGWRRNGSADARAAKLVAAEYQSSARRSSWPGASRLPER